MPAKNRLILLAALWLIPLLLFTSAFCFNWLAVWSTLRLPSMSPHFADLRSITGGLVTAKHGGDPLLANPYDPWGRRLNYPRVWLHLFSVLGVNDQNISIIALTFCVLYLICISCLMLRSERDRDAFLLLLASLSLAPLLAFERGNNDLCVFAVVFLGCLVMAPALRSGVFAVAALLKIYPFAALLVEGVRRPLKQKALPVLAGALALALFGWQWRDIHAIRVATPASATLSYGVPSLLAQQTGGLRFYVLALCALAGALILRLARLQPFHVADRLRNAMAGELFYIFGGIYVFTFLTSSNWDYRLIFLIPTLPLAFELARSPQQGLAGRAYIGLVLMAENAIGFGYRAGTLLCDFATVSLFFMISAILQGHFRECLFPKLGTAPAPASSARPVPTGD